MLYPIIAPYLTCDICLAFAKYINKWWFTITIVFLFFGVYVGFLSMVVVRCFLFFFV